MNLFFEESGRFLAAAVLSQQNESYQVELPTGKRSKVRAKDVFLQFSTPTPQHLLDDARKIADSVDVDFLWEVAGVDEFGVEDLGADYFGHAPLPVEAAGLLLCLQGAPVYFYKKGKGRYKAAPEIALKAALAGIEKKKQQAAIAAQWVIQLKAQQLPAAMTPLVTSLLFKPDKNSLEYKAFATACHELAVSPAQLMLSVGGFADAKALHLAAFLCEFFPKGVGFEGDFSADGGLSLDALAALPLASVQAFSVDDVTTTEIDDALSVTMLDDGCVRFGIHIAAPGLGISPKTAMDQLARSRLSTVYMPGDKITMLPEALVSQFSLDEGKVCPALSLYAVVDLEQARIVSTESCLERVRIAANLRNNHLDALVTEADLVNNNTSATDYPHQTEIALLWQWANQLEKVRMAQREAFGLKPEQGHRVDFNFHVDNDIVTITPRKRGAPLDKIVAELMIFANSTWGKLLSDHGLPGVYRTQGSNGGKMQVRMVTHAAPHQGLGVHQYAWSTSPLRRYVDLVNQWQIISCLQHGVAAPLVAPFKPRDPELFAIIASFEATYASYAEFQNKMERYWCLRWLSQKQQQQAQSVLHLDATILRENLCRLVDIPLVVNLPTAAQNSTQNTPRDGEVAHEAASSTANTSSTQPLMVRGGQVKLALLQWDEVTLSVEARCVGVVDNAGLGVIQTCALL